MTVIKYGLWMDQMEHETKMRVKVPWKLFQSQMPQSPTNLGLLSVWEAKLEFVEHLISKCWLSLAPKLSVCLQLKSYVILPHLMSSSRYWARFFRLVLVFSRPVRHSNLVLKESNNLADFVPCLVSPKQAKTSRSFEASLQSARNSRLVNFNNVQSFWELHEL